MSDNIQITAHSGSDGTPDNSLACVEYALSTAVDAFEVDVRRLADGTLALGHDAADHTAPTLREVLALAAAKPGVRVNCDLKACPADLFYPARSTWASSPRIPNCMTALRSTSTSRNTSPIFT